MRFLPLKLDPGALDELTFNVTVSYFFFTFKITQVIYAFVQYSYNTIKSKMKATSYQPLQFYYLQF